MNQRAWSRSRSLESRFWIGLSLILLVALGTAPAARAVEIVQSPLTSQLQLQPNMVLMLSLIHI